MVRRSPLVCSVRRSTCNPINTAALSRRLSPITPVSAKNCRRSLWACSRWPRNGFRLGQYGELTERPEPAADQRKGLEDPQCRHPEVGSGTTLGQMCTHVTEPLREFLRHGDDDDRQEQRDTEQRSPAFAPVPAAGEQVAERQHAEDQAGECAARSREEQACAGRDQQNDDVALAPVESRESGG